MRRDVASVILCSVELQAGEVLRPARFFVIIKEKEGALMPPGNVIWVVVFCLLGITACVVDFIKPKWRWKMRHWWDTVGGEPSEAYLYGARMAAVLGIIAFVCVLIYLYLERHY